MVPAPPEEPRPPRLLPSGLVVGSYCHDVLFRDGAVIGQGLGGAASFISNVLDSLDRPLHLNCRYVSKVGPDFAYASRPSLPPSVSPSSSSPTTLFHAHFSADHGGYHGDRILRRVRVCEPIYPDDLPTAAAGQPFDFGLAVGVAGEISPPTLERMLDTCRVVFVDVQALIRSFDPADGTVRLVRLRDSGFWDLLPRIGFLKASADEAAFLDVQEVRRLCCVVVTEGRDGCTVYWDSGQLRVPSFPADQVDPTGAGDSFLAGFVCGTVRGLPVHDAALLGNLLGSLTVRCIGVPNFHHELFQGIREEMERRTSGEGEAGCPGIVKTEPGCEAFQAILAEAADRLPVL